MKNLKNIKAILFDLDGTLVHDKEAQEQAFKKTLESFNLHIPSEEYPQRFLNKNILQIEEDLIKEFDLKIKKGAFREKRKELISELLSKETTSCSHYAKELLEFLSRRYPLAICSSGERQEVFAKLECNNLLKYFQRIVSAEDVQNLKPYPDVYLKGAQELGVKIEDCLAFEDSLPGVQAAKTAGALCFAIPSQNQKKQDFALADKVLKSLEEGYSLFQKI